jgi:hypothetical protein
MCVKFPPKMTPNRSPVVCELERGIASLPVEEKLQLLARESASLPVTEKLQLRDDLDRQIKSSACGKVAVDSDAEDWNDKEWRDFSLQGLSKAYGDDEPDYELVETQELKAI